MSDYNIQVREHESSICWPCPIDGLDRYQSENAVALESVALFEMDDVNVGNIMLPVQETESPRTPRRQIIRADVTAAVQDGTPKRSLRSASPPGSARGRKRMWSKSAVGDYPSVDSVETASVNKYHPKYHPLYVRWESLSGPSKRLVLRRCWQTCSRVINQFKKHGVFNWDQRT